MVDVDRLLKNLKDEDPRVSREAARELGRTGEERVLAPLLDYLAGKSHLNRAGVVFGFRHFQPDLVLEPLLNAFTEDDWNIRAAAFFAALNLREVRAIPAMIDILKLLASGEEETYDGINDDYSTYVFIKYIGEMCRRVGEPALFQDAVAPLRHFLNDPREQARRNAASSLTDLGVSV